MVGIVTNRDLRFETRLDAPVRDIMTPRERLVTVREGTTLAEGKALMHQHKLERVLVVNDAFELRGLMTVKDITKQTELPERRARRARQAARRRRGRRRRGHRRARRAAGEGRRRRDRRRHRARPQRGRARARALGQAATIPHVDVIGGNIATGAGALALVEAGADG